MSNDMLKLRFRYIYIIIYVYSTWKPPIGMVQDLKPQVWFPV
jgi:hypothetical protein